MTQTWYILNDADLYNSVIKQHGVVYSVVREADPGDTILLADGLQNLYFIGEIASGGEHIIGRAGIRFDTACLSGLTPTDAFLLAGYYRDGMSGHLCVTREGVEPSDPLTVNDYHPMFDTSTILGDDSGHVSDNGFHVIDVGTAYVNTTGNSYFILRHEEEINGTDPASDSWMFEIYSKTGDNIGDMFRLTNVPSYYSSTVTINISGTWTSTERPIILKVVVSDGTGEVYSNIDVRVFYYPGHRPEDGGESHPEDIIYNAWTNNIALFEDISYDLTGLSPGTDYIYGIEWRYSSYPDTVYTLIDYFATDPLPDPPVLILELAFDQSIFTEAPTWTDVSSDLMKLNVKRGRMHELDKIEAGTATFTLNNTSGNWWRYNTAGTYYVAAGHEVVKPLTLIRYSVTYNGTTYRRYYGVVESFKHSWLGEKGYAPIVELSCVDMFKSLNRCKLQALTSDKGAHTDVGVIDDDVGASGQAGQKLITLDNVNDINRLYAGQSLLIGDDAGGGTYEYNYIASIDYNTLTLTMAVNLANTYTEGNNAYVKKFQLTTSAVRIDDILYEWGWPQSLRDIDIGGITVSRLVPPTGGTSALEHLLDIVEAENGVFFFARDGKATFQNNTYRRDLTSSATYSDDGSDSHYVLPEPIDDDELIYNEVRISGDDITEQAIVDPDAQAEQGPRALIRTNSFIFYDADAFDQAYTLVQRFRDSYLRCHSLLIYPDADPTVIYPQVLAYDISTRINLELNSTENPAIIDEDYHIEGIEENWERDGDRYEITWQLWDVNQFQIVRAEHDGDIYAKDAVYATAHDAAAGTADNDAGAFGVGQFNVGAEYWIFRGFLQFPTTGIDPSKVLSAKILVKLNGYYPIDTAFYIIPCDPSTLANPLVATDYAVLHGSTSAWGTSTLIATPDVNTSFLEIELTQDAIDTINIAGSTMFGLRSNRDISATTPGVAGDEFVSIYGVATPETFTPRLLITYK